jgi:hypothetical protein
MCNKTYSSLQARSSGDKLLDLGHSLFQSRLGDVGQKHTGTLFGEEDCSLKANATF